MTPEAEDAEWVRRVAALTLQSGDTTCDPSPDTTEHVVERLGSLARTYVQDPCSRDSRLAVIHGWDEAAALATDLARWAPGDDLTPISGLELTLRYVEALRDAATAVYFCRRVQHAGGSCWFSIRGPRDGLCGRVLSVGHLLRAPVATQI